MRGLAGRVGAAVRDEEGQATLEYAAVLAALLAMLLALYAFARAEGDGTFARIAEASLSHAVGGGGSAADAVADVVMF